MNKQVMSVREDTQKNETQLKDNEFFKLVKIIEGKCDNTHATTYQKIWEDINGEFWVSHHMDWNFDEERTKHKIQKGWF